MRTASRDAADLWADHWRAPTPATKQALAACYVPYAQRLVDAMLRKGQVTGDRDELLSDAVFGLLDALRRYDAGRGIKFESFAARRVMGAVLDAVRSRDWVPRLERTRAKRGGRACAKMVHIQPRINPLDGRRENVEFEAVDPTDFAADLDYRLDLEAFVDAQPGLSRRDRRLLRLRFFQGRSFAAIGRALGLSESRVCQIMHELYERFGDRLPYVVNGRRAA